MQNIPYVRTAADLERKYNLSALPTIEKNTKTNQEQILKTNTILEEFTAETIKNLENLQNQVDGNVTTYYYSGVPTLLNPPVSDWKEEEYNVHLGDLYYDKDTGYAYRFYLDTEPNVYGWVRITDSDITEALAIANTAQDTADAKRRVFVVEPKPPYDVGDIWFKEDKDLFRCKLGRQKGDNFNNSDWILATNYTDDTAANEAKAELSDYKVYVATTYETQADFIKEKEALELKVSKVETVANDKNKVFTSEPTTPYLPGDVYIKETTIDGMKQNLIYVCQTGRESGDYNPNDFSLQPSYASQSDLKLTDNKIAGVVQSVENLEQDITTSKTASGNPIEVTDAGEYLLESIVIDGKSEQDGTPTPDTPVEIKNVTGVRNLFDLNDYDNSIISNGITTTNDGNTLICNGTITSSWSNITTNKKNKEIFKAGYYTFSIKEAINRELRLVIYNTNNTRIDDITLGIGKTTVTKEIKQDFYFSNLYLNNITSGTVIQNLNISNIQLEEGPIAHSYVPYGSWLKVQTTGKNLWGNEEHGSIDESTGQPIYNADRWRTIYFIRVEPNTNYTLSTKPTTSIIYYIFYYYKEDYTFISSKAMINTTYATNITPSNCKYMKCVICDTTTIKTENRQLEKGTKTDYEPYKENTALIDMNIYDEEGNITGHHELCSTKDGSVTDTINIDDIGNVTLTKRIGSVALDTIIWTIAGHNVANYKRYYTSNIPNIKYVPSNTIVGNGLAEKYKMVKGSGISSITDCLAIDVSMVSVCDTTTPTGQFIYVLAEPYTIELNYEPLKLFKGYNNITLNDELLPNMNIKYLTDSKLNAQYVSHAQLEIEKNKINSEINTKVSNTELDEVIEEQNNKITQQITESENSITLEVSETYSTKTETNQAKTEAINSANSSTDNKLKKYSTTEQVNASLALKVGKDENNQIVSMLNASANEINIKGDRFVLNSTNFKVDKTGNITAKNGTFKGGTLRLNDNGTQNGASIKIEVIENGNTRETTYSGYGIESDITTNYDYTKDDVTTIQNIIINHTTPTQEQLDKYDISGDGKIDVLDMFKIKQIVLMGISKNSPGHFSIDTHASFNDNIVITNGLKEKVVSIGLNGVEAIGGNLYYKDGDTYELTSFVGGGYVTNSGKVFNLGTLFTPKSLANINSVTLNEGGKLTVRQGNKYLVGSASNGATMSLKYCYAQKMGDNAIGIFYNAPSAPSGVVNNDAIGVIMSDLSITLNGYAEETAMASIVD